MPTPFYHLALAHEMLAQPSLPTVLAGHRAEFYLGNIAPDSQNMSGQLREATHFFDVPMRDPSPAWQTMFRLHPTLSSPAGLTSEHAAFMAGYLCHLALDQLWIAEIFDPIFGEEAIWATFRERLFLHNILRIYLDEQDRPLLANGVAAALRSATPHHWLPFLADSAVARWRDFVGGQLAEGGATQTIAVFAQRMGLSPTDFESLLQSPASMQAKVFSRMPLSSLARFRQRGLDTSLQVIHLYFSQSL